MDSMRLLMDLSQGCHGFCEDPYRFYKDFFGALSCDFDANSAQLRCDFDVIFIEIH